MSCLYKRGRDQLICCTFEYLGTGEGLLKFRLNIGCHRRSISMIQTTRPLLLLLGAIISKHTPSIMTLQVPVESWCCCGSEFLSSIVVQVRFGLSPLLCHHSTRYDSTFRSMLVMTSLIAFTISVPCTCRSIRQLHRNPSSMFNPIDCVVIVVDLRGVAC